MNKDRNFDDSGVYTKFDRLKTRNKIEIDNGCFLKNWFLTWTKRLRDIVIEGNSRSKPVLPKKLDISSNERYLISLQERMSLKDALHIFTLNRAIWPLVGISFCKILEFLQNFAIFRILEDWTDKTKYDKEKFDELLKYYLASILGVELFKGFMKNLCYFRLEKTGISLKAALTSLLQSKLLRKNFDNDVKINKEDFTEITGSMLTLYKEYPKYVSYVIQIWLHVLLTFALGAYIFGAVTFPVGLSVFIFVVFLVYFLLKKILKKAERKYKKHKYMRKEYVLDLIKNMFMVKCNAQEDFFQIKVSNFRKKELKSLNSIKFIERIFFFVSWIISIVTLNIIIFYFQGRVSDGRLAIGYAILARIAILTFFLILDFFASKKLNFERIRTLKYIQFFIESKEAEIWPGMYDRIDEYHMEEIKEITEEKFTKEKKNLKSEKKGKKKKKRKATGFAVAKKNGGEKPKKRKRKATGFLSPESLKEFRDEIDEDKENEDGKKENKSVQDKLKEINEKFQAEYGQGNFEHGEYVITTQDCFFYWEEKLTEYNKNFKNFYSEEEYNYTVLKQREFMMSRAGTSKKSTFIKKPLALGDSSIGMRAEELGINLEKYQLKDISLKILKGKFYYVLGSETSGLHSLLKALIGKMGLETLNGPEIKVKGTVYYMDYKPWLINGTIKENILLGKKYNYRKFERALELSGLKIDINEKVKGVMYYCGAQSESLNPLFKLKIEVARVIYSDPDIVMIDDAFRGMSCTESYRLFKAFITQGCKGKTILYASACHRFLHLSTHFIYMEEGKILKFGQKNLLKNYNEFEGVNLDENCEDGCNPVVIPMFQDDSEQEIPSSKDISNSELEISVRKFKFRNMMESSSTSLDFDSLAAISISRYSRSSSTFKGETSLFNQIAKRNKLILSMVLITYFICTFAQVWIFRKITSWAFQFNDPKEPKYTWNWIISRLIVYSFSTLSIPVGDFFLKSKFCVAINLNLHKKIVNGLFAADAYKMMTNLPLTVYGSKIHNDLVSTDRNLPYSMSNFLYNFFFFLAFSIFLCAVHQPVLSSFFIPSFMIIWAGFFFYTKERSELINIESELKIQENYLSKVILDGVDRIRGMKLQGYFKAQMTEILQNQILAELYMSGKSHWFKIRVFTIVLILAVFPTYTYLAYFYERDHAFPCNVIVIAFTPLLPRILINTFGEFDKIKTSICRINDCLSISRFGKNLKKEKNRNQNFDSAALSINSETTTENVVEINETFEKGEIRIENLNVFSIGPDPIIKDFSISIKPGEHVALVSDPDTPVAAIFDIIMMFLKTYSGDIIIDNKFLEAVSEESVRKQIHFSDINFPIMKGILKDNISALRGKQIVKELECYSLINFFKKYKFSEKKFENYGYSTPLNPKKICKRDKILMSLGNIFMAKKKILLIDRIDSEFDDGLRKCFFDVKAELKENGKTLLMLCSKMETVMEFDRVVVFKNGQVVEEGDPDLLYGDENSRVREMYDRESEIGEE